ncbi:bifunctional lysylphosphatidylglycerol flippase/synthetase MprF [Antrihabitans stalactiti]|uniref:DUF2156 domain-containing protein n=1 Tax=Antrihabitans stalactiti TaxID=2584121 RepID=A0A848KQS7_9NOCA|nr:phosphatidylglycerol lysyltransferase domain-containing protein [Antrihabitans stalactiti]NMN98942.1 DUF2156 domain-containing protein [Antrihabitans stalactiti]
MHVRVTTRSGLREGINGSGAGVLRPLASFCVLLISVVLAYSAIRAAREGTAEGWLFAAALSGLFVARGLHLRRPISLAHTTFAVLFIAFGDLGYRADYQTVGFVLIGASGFVFMLAPRSKPQPQQLCAVAALVSRTIDDPLAPFALHSWKSYFFNEGQTAAIAYRTRAGIAVVAGDPIGAAQDFPLLIADFSAFARDHGWRVAVLGAGERCLPLWQAQSGGRAVPIGRDVVIDVDDFNLEGRRFRNLRQAVSRTHNFGIKTDIEWEAALSESTRAELMGIVDEWHAGHQNRGFSMILDHLLDGRHPGMLVVIARDSHGRAVGFQRYGTSAGGRELSIDVPWRTLDAPNGVDERMTIDVIDYAKDTGANRVSLAFGAFPELFADEPQTRLSRIARALVHVGDPLLNLESLYRFLRKFHAFADRRYVLVRVRDLLPAVFAMLTLEFVPHRLEY